MTKTEEDPFVGSVRRKAERMKKHRASKDRLWATIGRTVGIGWMVELPIAAGEALGHWFSRVHGRPLVAVLGLGLGLAVGVYGAYVQVHRLLAAEREEADVEPGGEGPRDDP